MSLQVGYNPAHILSKMTLDLSYNTSLFPPEGGESALVCSNVLFYKGLGEKHCMFSSNTQ